MAKKSKASKSKTKKTKTSKSKKSKSTGIKRTKKKYHTGKGGHFKYHYYKGQTLKKFWHQWLKAFDRWKVSPAGSVYRGEPPANRRATKSRKWARAKKRFLLERAHKKRVAAASRNPFVKVVKQLSRGGKYKGYAPGSNPLMKDAASIYNYPHGKSPKYKKTGRTRRQAALEADHPYTRFVAQYAASNPKYTKGKFMQSAAKAWRDEGHTKRKRPRLRVSNVGKVKYQAAPKGVAKKTKKKKKGTKKTSPTTKKTKKKKKGTKKTSPTTKKTKKKKKSKVEYGEPWTRGLTKKELEARTVAYVKEYQKAQGSDRKRAMTAARKVFPKEEGYGPPKLSMKGLGNTRRNIELEEADLFFV